MPVLYCQHMLNGLWKIISCKIVRFLAGTDYNDWFSKRVYSLWKVLCKHNEGIKGCSYHRDWKSAKKREPLVIRGARLAHHPEFNSGSRKGQDFTYIFRKTAPNIILCPPIRCWEYRFIIKALVSS